MSKFKVGQHVYKRITGLSANPTEYIVMDVINNDFCCIRDVGDSTHHLNMMIQDEKLVPKVDVGNVCKILYVPGVELSEMYPYCIIVRMPAENQLVIQTTSTNSGKPITYTTYQGGVELLKKEVSQNQFKIGDVVRILDLPGAPKYNGAEAVVSSIHNISITIRTLDGDVFSAYPEGLLLISHSLVDEGNEGLKGPKGVVEKYENPIVIKETNINFNFNI